MRIAMTIVTVLAAPSCAPEYPLCNPGVPPPCIRNCSDGAKNGDETSIDCGGSCKPCAEGKRCAVMVDCESHACVNQRCEAPTCTDGVRNGVETDVDCGGREGRHDGDAGSAKRDGGTAATLCPRCTQGMSCELDEDCWAGLCVAGLCSASLCQDGVRNAMETDVDCGGGSCPKCGPRQRCMAATDCLSMVCFNSACR